MKRFTTEIEEITEILPWLPNDILFTNIFNWCNIPQLLSYTIVSHRWYNTIYEFITELNLYEIHLTNIHWSLIIPLIKQMTQLETLILPYLEYDDRIGLRDVAPRIKQLCFSPLVPTSDLIILSPFINLTMLYLNEIEDFDGAYVVDLKNLRSLFLVEVYCYNYTWLSQMKSLRHLVMDNSGYSPTIIDAFTSAQQIDYSISCLVHLRTLIINSLPTTLSFLEYLTKLQLLDIHGIWVQSDAKVYNNMIHIMKLTRLTHLFMPKRIELISFDLFLPLKNLVCLSINHISGNYTLLNQLHKLSHIRIMFSYSFNLKMDICHNLSNIHRLINVTLTLNNFDEKAKLTFLGIYSILYKFFERDYKNEDFSSQCEYTYETNLKEKDLAIFKIIKKFYNYIRDNPSLGLKYCSDIVEDLYCKDLYYKM